MLKYLIPLFLFANLSYANVKCDVFVNKTFSKYGQNITLNNIQYSYEYDRELILGLSFKASKEVYIPMAGVYVDNVLQGFVYNIDNKSDLMKQLQKLKDSGYKFSWLKTCYAGKMGLHVYKLYGKELRK